MSRTPVAVVGGGPAGSVAALLLARAGVPCTVYERTSQPAPKVCGEFLSPEAVTLLSALGFPWQRVGAVTLDLVRLYNGDRNTTAALPFSPAARSLPRQVLDEWLLAEAGRIGARIERGCQISDIETHGGRFVLHVAGASKTVVEADDVILATGKHGLRAFHRREPTQPQNLVGYKMNFTHLSAELRAALDRTLALFFFPGGYGGVARVAPDELTISLLIQNHLVRTHGSRDTALLNALASNSPLLRQVLQQATPAWPRPLTVANLPYGHCDPATTSVPGLFAVGDQFAVLPSFTGTGLAFALTTGQLAAEHLLAHPHAHAASAYAGAAHRNAQAVMRRALWLHRWLQRPIFARAALVAVSFMPRLTGAVARATRLPAARALASAGAAPASEIVR